MAKRFWMSDWSRDYATLDTERTFVVHGVEHRCRVSCSGGHGSYYWHWHLYRRDHRTSTGWVCIDMSEGFGERTKARAKMRVTRRAHRLAQRAV